MTLSGAPTIEVHGGLQQALAVGSLAAIPTGYLEQWLGARRWFGAKRRPISSALFRSIAPVPLPAGAAVMAVLEVSFEQPSELARFQLPLLVSANTENAGSASTVLAHVRGDGESGFVIDATEDARFQGRIGELLGTGAVLPTTDGRWVFEAIGSSSHEVFKSSRLGHAEQSNSSIVYGDSAILKLFRRLEVGEHPDVEIARFLTTRTAFRNTPELLGSLRLEGPVGASVAGMLSRFVAGATDAWTHALSRVREYLGARADSPANAFADEARQLGRVTRELHEALSSVTDDQAFAPAHVGRTEITVWAEAARFATERGLDLLDRRVDTLDPTMGAQAKALLRRRESAYARVSALSRDLVAHDAGLSIRHHGDYHLGQVLRTPHGDWMIIDFEGEPTRPLSSRRALHSPLRDVAGMLRSFAYAASSGAMEAGGVGADARLESRAARWERDVRSAFLDGYFASTREAPVKGLLPGSRVSATALLTLFEVEKIFYELDYELNNRPTWVWIPLRGIAKLF
ncbi:MAG: hypothetical protein H7Z74_18345 [Anaerolineae bacterium]|nr:hypothetical protein [Gemmatimonadaceae bacterium]